MRQCEAAAEVGLVHDDCAFAFHSCASSDNCTTFSVITQDSLTNLCYLWYHDIMESETGMNPRDRILQAAARLLAEGGREAVSTRAVSRAAGVQAPTIYRQFGDMQGLLDAVASH